MITPMVEKIAALISLALTAAAVGVLVYTTVLYKKPLPKNDVEFEKMKEEAKVFAKPITVEMKKFVINLNSKDTKMRFVDMKIFLVPFKAQDKDLLMQRQERLSDIVISTTGSMTSEELNSIAGKLLLEGRLKKRMNESLKGDYIQAIHFSNFVIQ